MKKSLFPRLLFIVYSAILVKVMVLKDVPLIRLGKLMINFGGTAEGQANFVPFKTIGPYLFGHKGLMIAGINIVGNIALLLPVGFLVPFVYTNMTWKKAFALGVVVGLVIEVLQVVLRVGIFDIDDVILNALGVVMGYGVFVVLSHWLRSKKYAYIIISAVLVIAAAGATLYALYPHGQQPVADSDPQGREPIILQ